MRIVMIVIGLLLISVSAIETVKELNIKAYMGDWYEVAESPLVRALTERNGFCTQARYTLLEDGSIAIINSLRIGSVTGTIKQLTGQAVQLDASEPGKLVLDLQSAPMKNSYWIVALGPIVDGQYQWAVVSEPKSILMWVLARDPKVFLDQYQKSVKAYVMDDLKFNRFWNKYGDRSHEGCLPIEY